MELTHQRKLAQHIFRLLKVTEIVFPIGRTNKGNLGLKFTQNSEDFEIMLDAVPLQTKDILNDDNNIELKAMIEKYWFNKSQVFESLANFVDNGTNNVNVRKVVDSAGNDVTDKVLPPEPKKRGRPKKIA